MSNISIDVNRACSPDGKAYAAMVARSGDATSSQMSKIIAYWGAEQVQQWQSVDSTEYEIDDTEKANARAEGDKKAKEKTDGYERDKTGNWVGTGAVGVAAGTSIVFEICALIGNVKGAVNSPSRTCLYIAAGLSAAVVAMYFATNPNKEAANALGELTGLMGEEQNALGIEQENMRTASEENADLAEEAAKKNDEAGEQIEINKTEFDFYREQLMALIEKAEAAKNGGEPLTQDEKALLAKLAPVMQALIDGIGETQEGVSEELEGIYDTMAEYQDTYDTSAEKIEMIQAETDYAASFDSDTAANSKVLQFALYGNAAAAAAVAARLLAQPGIWSKVTDLVFAGIASVAGVASYSAAQQQAERHDIASMEVDAREMTEDINNETRDVYDEELDNFVGSMETVDDLEIEIPEDTEMPDESAVSNAITSSGSSDGSGNPFVAAQSGDDGTANSPLTAGSGAGSIRGTASTGGTSSVGTFGSLTGAGSTGGASGTGGTAAGNGTTDTTGNGTSVNNDEDGNNGNGETRGASGSNRASGANDIPLTSDPAYISAMGNGSDWSEVMNRNISRKSDDDIVTDESGKVVLSNKYAEAIESVSNVKEGEWFSKNDIPKILEKVLGAPFDAKIIKDVKDGKQLDSEYTTKILGSKDQDDRGSGTKDNSKTATTLAKRVIDFYWPIFEKASTKGWRRG